VAFGKGLGINIPKPHLIKLPQPVDLVRLQPFDDCDMVGMNVCDHVGAEIPGLCVDRELRPFMRLPGFPVLGQIPLRKLPRQVVDRCAKILHRFGSREAKLQRQLWDALERDLDGARIRIELLPEGNRVGIIRERGDLGFKSVELLVCPSDLRQSAF
jgi:hypothetical protein